MALASTGTDIVTGICMAVVLGMSGLLVYRATRSRPEDAEDRDPDAEVMPSRSGASDGPGQRA